MVDFIRALRAAGVRVSLAESQDAMYGVDAVGVAGRAQFAAALKATLVKERRDQATFDYFFPLFFSAGQPPLEDIPASLKPDDADTLRQALQTLMGDRQALRELLQRLMQGQPFERDQLAQMGARAGLNQGDEMYQRQWFERRMQRDAGLQQLQALIEALLQALEEMGMSAPARAQVRDLMEQNADGLRGQIAQYAGAALAQQMAERDPQPRPDLLDVPFTHLGREEVEAIRDEIKRLAARLRSRAALRQRRDRAGSPDPRRTMRAALRYGGVPLEIRYRTRQVKPCLVLICDVSTSMRYCAEFLLTLVYELQDQVARTNSFIFIDDIKDISSVFSQGEPRDAVARVLADNRPGYYNTDLGASLSTFAHEHLGCVDHRATVIILGDGRNNHNNPRLDLAQMLQRRARRLLWFNPEPPSMWGTGDSDMLGYAPLADGVYQVGSLRELAAAVDKILTDR